MRRLAVAINETTISIAWVEEGGRLGEVRSWSIDTFRTLTDALLAFERDGGIRLTDTACAISVQGATEGDSIVLARSNWAISRAGLRSMFGRDVVILNDVAARAWAVIGGAVKMEALSSHPASFRFDQPGRYAFTNMDAGVGLAVIDVDAAGIPRVLESEMGHCGFAAVTDEDRALAAAVAKSPGGLVTWEQVLTVPLDDGSLWAQPGLPRMASNRADLIVRLVGRYVGDTVMAHGAWGGALVTGQRFHDLVVGPGVAAFNSSFEYKSKFTRLIRATPRARITGDALTLHGCAVVLARAD